MEALTLGGQSEAGRLILLGHAIDCSVVSMISVLPSIPQALDRSYDYVIVSTKAIPEITRTPTLLSPLLTLPYAGTHLQPTYVLLQNGLNVEKDLYIALKEIEEEPKIISTAVRIGTNMTNANIVEHNELVQKEYKDFTE